MPALSSTPPGGLTMGSSSGAGTGGITDADAQALGLSSAAELQESLALQASLDANQSAASPSAAPAAGISFARMAKLGYAATGPTLSGASPPTGGPSVGVAPVQPQGVWAIKPAAPKSSASSSGPSICIPAPVVAAANHAALSATTLAQTTQLMQTLGFNIPSVASGSTSSNSVNVVKSTRGQGQGPAAVQAPTSSSWGRPLSGATSSSGSQGQQQGGAVGGAEGDGAKSKGNKKGKTLLFTSGASRKY